MYCSAILRRVEKITDRISSEEAEEFITLIKNAPRIYVVGAGRSGFVTKAFAMRLVQLKKKVFVVGETVTPALRKGDVLLAISGSGQTYSVISVAKVAKELKGKVVAITSKRNSELASFSDMLVIIPTQREPRSIDDYEVRKLMGIPITPLGSLFEISTLIFLEACVVELMQQLGVEEEEMARVHANLF